MSVCWVFLKLLVFQTSETIVCPQYPLKAPARSCVLCLHKMTMHIPNLLFFVLKSCALPFHSAMAFMLPFHFWINLYSHLPRGNKDLQFLTCEYLSLFVLKFGEFYCKVDLSTVYQFLWKELSALLMPFLTQQKTKFLKNDLLLAKERGKNLSCCHFFVIVTF